MIPLIDTSVHDLQEDPQCLFSGACVYIQYKESVMIHFICLGNLIYHQGVFNNTSILH